MLRVQDVKVEYNQGGSVATVLRGVTLNVAKGAALALVGESGSGKSTLALAVMRMIQAPAGKITEGDVWLDGDNLTALPAAEMRAVLRTRIAFIPQDPTTSLDPLFTIRSQVAEVMPRMRRQEQDRRIADLLTSLGVVDAAARLKSYPHEFSGGMRQRVAMTIALAKEPDLLIADEPTTALDVTTQLGLLRVLDALRTERHLTTLFITHNLRVARLLCQDVAVMYAGYIVESGSMAHVLSAPAHPYTKALLDVSAAGSQPGGRIPAIPGQPPSPQDTMPGCPFAPRCPRVQDRCWSVMPDVTTRADGVSYRCWNPVTA